MSADGIISTTWVRSFGRFDSCVDISCTAHRDGADDLAGSRALDVLRRDRAVLVGSQGVLALGWRCKAQARGERAAHHEFAGGGLDELRTWLANLLFWHIGGRCATYDTLLPSSRVPLHVALQEIMYLRENFPELNSDASVCYVADLLSSMPLPPGEDYYADSMQVSNSELNRSVGAVGSPSPNGPVGMVLPLHCGHNGWPPMSDLSLLVEAIRAAAFDVCPTV